MANSSCEDGKHWCLVLCLWGCLQMQKCVEVLTTASACPLTSNHTRPLPGVRLRVWWCVPVPVGCVVVCAGAGGVCGGGLTLKVHPHVCQGTAAEAQRHESGTPEVA
eukprot:NODE_5685_length_625_cov_15.765060_g5521_i0.p3 GENE.NODE_5685_length_625_cov_15.765060_g5521_i0~~NODE_5685_length_625_cov_15.765060_g5521_i0.p3  ORF type:complete len:114 (+),score=30.78 NODE_5685_length_625_cov_15.765060_g5521_i0:22-342(+)